MVDIDEDSLDRFQEIDLSCERGFGWRWTRGGRIDSKGNALWVGLALLLVVSGGGDAPDFLIVSLRLG
jgi:hypothetical protein